MNLGELNCLKLMRKDRKNRGQGERGVVVKWLPVSNVSRKGGEGNMDEASGTIKEKGEVLTEKQGVTGIESHRAGKYLTFKLAGEEYGLEILKVREIMGMMEITSVPKTPDFIHGVINLRGKVIPVIDLRTKFGLKKTETTDETCIIVVEVSKNGDSIQTGILVDTVSEVMDIPEVDIEDTPAFGDEVDTNFILGMAKSKGDVKILLNIEKVLTTNVKAAISQLAEV